MSIGLFLRDVFLILNVILPWKLSIGPYWLMSPPSQSPGKIGGKVCCKGKVRSFLGRLNYVEEKTWDNMEEESRTCETDRDRIS
jgi:hypothetical protein